MVYLLVQTYAKVGGCTLLSFSVNVREGWWMYALVF
jgi:hypothetical protein